MVPFSPDYGKFRPDSNPRHINALMGKDGLPVALTETH